MTSVGRRRSRLKELAASYALPEATGFILVFTLAVNGAADINAKRAVLAAHLLPELPRAEDRDETIRDLFGGSRCAKIGRTIRPKVPMDKPIASG